MFVVLLFQPQIGAIQAVSREAYFTAFAGTLFLTSPINSYIYVYVCVCVKLFKQMQDLILQVVVVVLSLQTSQLPRRVDSRTSEVFFFSHHIFYVEAYTVSCFFSSVSRF